jgi:O-antigen/teichoic acid export membrane protein
VSAVATLAPTAPVHDRLHAASEGVLATRNALTLGGTMVAGMAISLVVRLAVVRLLGPEAFGQLRFAENAAEMLFIGLTLGVDTLLRREAAIDADAARGYLRALLVLRVLGAAILLTLIGGGLALAGHGAYTLTLFGVLGVAQLLVVLNNSYSAIEHATGRIAWIARVTLLFKLLWAALVLGVLLFAPSGLAFAAVFVIVELLRLARLSTRNAAAASVSRPGLGVAGAAAVASLPFFIHYLAHSLYARLGVWWLGANGAGQEVGWYGAAATIAAVAMLGMPLISWVLVPAAAREGARGEAGLAALFTGALRMALLVAVPVSTIIGLAAPFWVRVLFGDAYDDAAGALRALAPTFTLAYVATICSVILVQRRQVKRMATVSVAGLALSVLLNAMLVPYGAASGGSGGAANGAALATLLTEVAVTAALLRLTWTSGWGPAMMRTLTGLALAVLLAALAAGLPIHPLAAAVAATMMALLTLAATRAVTAVDIAFCRSVVRSRRQHGQAF